MNAIRRTQYKTISRIRAWNADLNSERLRALADAAFVPADTGADGPAAVARLTRTVDVEGRSTGSATKGERITARRVVCECQIDKYYAQRHIDADTHQAGLWFRRCYLLGYRNSNVTANYEMDKIPGRSGDDMSVFAINARHDLGQIAQALSQLEWAAVEAAAGHNEILGAGRLRYLVSGLAVVALYRDVTAAQKDGCIVHGAP